MSDYKSKFLDFLTRIFLSAKCCSVCGGLTPRKFMTKDKCIFCFDKEDQEKRTKNDS